MKKISAFGEILMRLDVLDEEKEEYRVSYGGTEANVLAALSSFGYKTAYLSALPMNEIGRDVASHFEGYGIDMSNVLLRGEKMGKYYVKKGTGSRGADVTYDRKQSECAKLAIGDFDYDTIFDGVSLFHISGISFALSDSSRELAFSLLREARARGILTSFDFNYRPKLWTTETAAPILQEACRLADIILGSKLDLVTFMKSSIDRLFDDFPNAKIISFRDRRVLSDHEHAVKIAVYTKNACYKTREIVFPVKERIGGGDAYAAGFLRSVLQGEGFQTEAIPFALAAFIAKHQVPGDVYQGGREEDYFAMLGDVFA